MSLGGNYLILDSNPGMGPVIKFNDHTIQVTRSFADKYFRDDLKKLHEIVIDGSLREVSKILNHLDDDVINVIISSCCKTCFRLFHKNILYNSINLLSHECRTETLASKIFGDIVCYNVVG